ncbi:MAG: bifunctional 5,10-methylenetetrahydrofolate dehydrogenase/5,10-methenyltetrahydrofolate cyclohydrolase [Bacillota bacterium]
MPKILQAKSVVQALKERMKEEIGSMNEKGVFPTLGIIRVGNRPDDVAYERSIMKNCDSIGMKVQVFEAPLDIPMGEFENFIEKINHDKNIHGILLFRPLPAQLDINKIKHMISPEKDIDCMNPVNLEKVFEGEKDGYYPCTPEAVVEILKYYEIPLLGANVVIVNSSLVVGRPLGMMLLGEKSTVTLCNSKTRDLPGVTSSADIVAVAVGRARMFGPEYFHENSVVIDVGINDAGDGKICGDVDYDSVVDKVQAITPVPGGVGTVTTTILLRHVLEACKKQHREQ